MANRKFVKDLKDVQDLSKMMDKMVGQWDKLSDAQKQNVDLVKDYAEGMKESKKYSKENLDSASNLSKTAKVALKGGVNRNKLHLAGLKIKQKMFGIDTANQQSLAKQAIAMKKANKSGSRMMGSMKSVGKFVSGIAMKLAAWLAPLLLIKKIFVGFSKTIDDAGQSFGAIGLKSEKLLGVYKQSDNELRGMGLNMNDVAGAVDSMVSGMGLSNAEAIKMAVNTGKLSKNLGISTDTAAKLIENFTMLSGSTEEQAVQLTNAVGIMSGSAGVSPQVVLRDMADSQETIAKFGTKSAANIAKAAVNARKFGNNLGTAEKMASSLLDFETSIAKEMEASVLIGKQLNYNTARQKALQGDLSGAMEDIVTQLGGAAEFEKMNVIQRQALADSIGVSVGEMAKFMNKQEEVNDLAEAGAEEMENMKPEFNPEDAMSAMTQMQNSFDQLMSTLQNELGPVLENIAQTLFGWWETLTKSEIVVKGIKFIGDGLATIWEGLTTKTGELNEELKGKTEAILERVKSILKAVWEILKPIVDIFIEMLPSWEQWGNMALAVLDTVDGLLKIIQGIITLDWGLMKEGFKQTFEGMKEFMINAFTNTFNVIADLFRGLGNVIVEGLEAAKTAISDAIMWPFNKAKEALEWLWPGSPSPLADAIAQGLVYGGPKIESALTEPFESAALKTSTTTTTNTGGGNEGTIAVAIRDALNGLELKTTVTREQLNFILTPSNS
tara:strand:+ start:1415 stop:3586 length:2172 start_codon:yes stop_codon:yes gene_type:complete